MWFYFNVKHTFFTANVFSSSFLCRQKAFLAACTHGHEWHERRCRPADLSWGYSRSPREHPALINLRVSFYWSMKHENYNSCQTNSHKTNTLRVSYQTQGCWWWCCLQGQKKKFQRCFPKLSTQWKRRYFPFPYYWEVFFFLLKNILDKNFSGCRTSRISKGVF